MKKKANYGYIKIIFKGTAFALLFTFLSGCSPMTYKFKDGSSSTSYFGYIKFIEPPTLSPNDDFKVAEIEAYGIRISKGIGLGYFHERLETVPLDCRIVIRVNNEKQFKMAEEIIFPIAKEGVCLTTDQSQH
jgi:hypothetical protein